MDLQQHIDLLAQLSPGEDSYTETVDRLVADGVTVNSLLDAINSHEKNTPSAITAAQLTAELSKADCARQQLAESGVIPRLVQLLNDENKELSLQCVRALGNLCYEQDTSRDKIIEAGGISDIEKLLQFCVDQRVGVFTQLKTACCGFIHNLLNSNENSRKAAMDSEMVVLLKSMLEINSSSASMCNFIYLAYNSLTEIEGGREALYGHEVIPTLVKILVNTNIKDTEELLLSLISALTAESDDVKKALAESSIDMHLLRIISLLNNSTDEEDQTLVKSASELLVLVLTGDEAMSIWFDGGNGYVFASVSEWLHGSNGQLLQSAAFAIGNFARHDENSHIIIQRGLSLELCKCLKQLHEFRNDGRTAPTIHALLSALRNLAIAPHNKDQLLEQGILDYLLPYIDTEGSVVTSKLVGVLRLLVDKHEKEATVLGMNKSLIDKLVEFGNSETNMLLKGESTRCLAWIIKNSKSADVMSNVLNSGAFKHLLFLVTSEHVIMQNEGLIAITLLTTYIPEETLVFVKESSLIVTLIEILNKEEPAASKEISQNILVYITELINKGMKEEFTGCAADVKSALDKTSQRYTESPFDTLISCISKSLTI